RTGSPGVAAARRALAAARQTSDPAAARSCAPDGAPHRGPRRSLCGARSVTLPFRVGQAAFDGARLVVAFCLEFNDDRVVAFPLRGHVGPRGVRLPAQFLADAIARDAPHGDLVVAVRWTEIRDCSVLEVG